MSSGVDLDGELGEALEAMPPAYVDKLVMLGVARDDFDLGLIGFAHVREVRGGLYEPDPAGEPALVTPCRIHFPVGPETPVPESAVRVGQVADLVCWFPRRPAHWLLRTGTATWLGAIEPQLMEPAPTPIWRGPLNWLTHNCTGLVVLTRCRREAYALLAGLGGIVAEDAHHQAALRRVLEHPWRAPPITVRAAEVRNAAAA